MAQSRLEKIGTIFTRVSGLLNAKAMKPEDKPIWYDVYAAFPPKLEPKFDRPAPNIPIRNIFYEEDVVRAKFQKEVRQQDIINLSDTKRETNNQKFIKIFNGLNTQGALDQEQVFDTAKNMFEQERLQHYNKSEYPEESHDVNVAASSNNSTLLRDFNEAKSEHLKSPNTGNNINISNLFKE